MHLFLPLILSVSLAACIKVTDKASDAHSYFSPQNQASEQLEPIIQGGDPHQYKVLIPYQDQVHLVRRTSLSDGADFTYLNPRSDEAGFIDSSVIAGQSYSYELGYYSDNEFLVIHSYILRIPLDLEVRGKLVLNENSNWSYGRIFFQKDSLLLTMGHRLEIKADEIISEGGLVETFPSEGSQPGKGRHGSVVSIHTQKARGFLKFIMRGENGAQGITGQLSRCEENNGPPVYNPGDGFVGQDGGDTGFLKMQIVQPHELQIEVNSIAGLAGPGGEPGGKCNPFMATAKQGHSGRSGQKQISCLIDFQGQHCY